MSMPFSAHGAIVEVVAQGFLSEQRPIRVLKDMIKLMQEAYCKSTGIEYMHITDRLKCNWIRQRVELPEAFQVQLFLKPVRPLC